MRRARWRGQRQQLIVADPDRPTQPERCVFAPTLRELARFDASALNLPGGIRMGAGLLIALVVGLAFNSPDAAATMAAGALLVGVTIVVGGPRPSLGLLGVITLAMALSSFVGSVTGGLGWVHTALLVPWCLVGGLLMALGSPSSSVGTQAVAAMIVFGRFPESLPLAGALAGYVIAGGAIQIAMVALTRLPATFAAQREAVASACLTLGALARPRPSPRSGLATAEAIEAAEASLGSFERAGMGDLGSLRALLDVARRARIELLVLDGLLGRFARTEGGDELPQIVNQLLEQFADSLLALGEALPATPEHSRSLLEAVEMRLEDATGNLERLTAALEREILGDHKVADRQAMAEPGRDSAAVLERSIVQHLSSLAGQVRAIVDLACRVDARAHRGRRPLLERGERPARRLQVRRGLEAISAHCNLDSAIARHALRLTIVVIAAEILAERTPLQRGYWVALTASVVLRPDFSATFSRGFARVVGTLLGVGLAGIFDLAIHPSDTAMVITATVFCVAAGAAFQASYVAYTGFLTGLVVLIVSFVSPGTLSLALDRLADTAIGGTLALLAYALWPSWSRADAWRALGTLAAAQRTYVALVFAVLLGKRPYDEAEARQVSASARRARANAETTVGRSLAEPNMRRIDPRASQGVLAALRRINLATHALRTEAARRSVTSAPVELDAFGIAVEEALEQVHDALGRRVQPDGPSRTGALVASVLGAEPAAPPHRQVALPPLRRLHGELSRALSARRDSATLLGDTDELVDAIDTAAHLLGLEDVR